MKLFPAIDILNGRCVRLYRGDFNQATVYGDPIEMACKWESQGADFLHVVDLNGAYDGSDVNVETIRRLCAAVTIPVQLGGGIRTEEIAEKRLQAGVHRVILGTVCCGDVRTVAGFVKRFGADRLVAGIDCKDGRVAVRGWVETTELTGTELALRMRDVGIRTTVYTDISRDGALVGVNVEACKLLTEATGLQVIASGGVGSLEDIRRLRAADVYGAILGKALYEHKFDVKDAKKEVL